MNEEEEWSELMRGVSDGIGTIEDAAAKFEDGLRACDRVLLLGNRGELDSSVLQGIAVGLAFAAGIEWTASAPELITDMQGRLAEHDAKVAAGELPSSAHTWRYQVQQRLTDLRSRVERLREDLIDRRGRLERLAGRS